jgi:hypothetical protein
MPASGEEGLETQMQGRALFEQLPQDDNLRRSVRIPSVDFYHGEKVLSSTHENNLYNDSCRTGEVRLLRCLYTEYIYHI